MEELSNVNVNDEFLFREGKKGFVAWDSDGRAILSKVKSNGYYRVSKILRKAPNFTLVQVEKVVKDLYDGISVEEAKQVLTKFGFKFIERPFVYDRTQYGEENTEEVQILAYNVESGIIAIGESWDGKERFNTFNFTRPGINGFEIRIKNMGYSQGSGNFAVFNSEFSTCEDFLETLLSFKANNMEWTYNMSLHLWTYADKFDDCDKMFQAARQRIFLFPEEAQEMLKNTSDMKLALAGC